MTSQNASADCRLVGEYVDEATCPASLPNGGSEVVRPKVVANCFDVWGNEDGLREFTVLLQDGRILSVRGHGLKHQLPTQGGQETFGVFVRVDEEDVVVALFRSQDVSGIFCGEIRSDRKIA